MPKIIYKQRHTEEDGPNKGRKFTPARNAGFVRYMGEKVHVLPTSHEERLVKYMGEREHVGHRLEAPNGLFGVINGQFSDNYSTSEMQQYVRKMSTPHRNIYHSIFSFTNDSAKEAGLNTLADWENWVKYHTSEIAKNMNVKIENLEYLAAVHLKENQPHVHIIWWDKEQQIYINKVEDVICDQIRIDVTKSTYRDLFNDIHNKEEVMRRELRKSIGEFAVNSVINGAADDYSMQIMARIQSIAEALPPKGQLKYKYQKLGSRAKTELDNLTHFIINNNEKFKAQYDEIREQRLLYNQLLHSDTSDYGSYQADLYMKKLDDKIENAVGNEILRIIKSEMKAGRMTIGTPSERYDVPAEPEYSETECLPEVDTVTLGTSDPPNRTRYKILWSDEFKQAKDYAKNGNFEKALELYKKGAAKGNVLAIYEIADLYRRELLVGEEPDKYYKLALEGFLSIEHNTSLKPYVQYRIGRMYYDGYGTEVNYPTSFEWLSKAVENGNNYAALAAAEILSNPETQLYNIQSAREYLNNALQRVGANKGNLSDVEFLSRANYKLGRFYLVEDGYNPKLAEDHLKRAVALGNAYAMHALAQLYIHDTKNFNRLDIAVMLLNNAKAANPRISPLADYTFGTMYLYNDKVKDIALAKRHLTASANAGNEHARMVLESFTANSVIKLINSTGRLLAENSEMTNAALNQCTKSVFGRGDLSKEQIKELLLKRSDKENTAEM
ncbi:MAG: hypothetical protein ACI4JS_01635 [Oscillospiraceae bacterium]